MHQLCKEIELDLGSLFADLVMRGFTLRGSWYSSEVFGNYCVDFFGRNKSFRVVKDRNQYLFEGDQNDLEPVGMRQAFDDREEFAEAVLAWLK
jgi:hypothetical protein